MYPIDTNDASTTEPSRPSQGIAKFFVNRTIVPDWWLNMVQNEIRNVLNRFGITPSKTNDSQLADAVEAAAIIKANEVELSYAPISSGTLALSQSGTGSYTYVISSFAGTGLSPTQIRGIHVECFTGGGNSHNDNVYATLPDGTETMICRSYGFNDDDDCWSGCMVYVPVNAGQTNFTLRCLSNASFIIRGATQKSLAS